MSDPDVLTELYDLRSRAGVVRVHAQHQHMIFVATSCAIVQEELTRAIDRLQAQMKQPQTPLPLQDNSPEKSHQSPGEA